MAYRSSHQRGLLSQKKKQTPKTQKNPLNIYFYFILCICVRGLCTQVQCPLGPEEGIGFPWGKVAGCCELPHMDAKN